VTKPRIVAGLPFAILHYNIQMKVIKAMPIADASNGSRKTE